jgi:hypothetical protein
MIRPAVLVLLAAPLCLAQNFEQRGFLDSSSYFYPQTAPGDSGLAVSQLLLRYEMFYKPSSHWRFSGGVDFRTDTHHQVDRALDFNWWDRTLPQQAAAIRRLSVTYKSGGFNLELGKQFIRWGKADILNPTDRFAPREYMNVVDTDFIGVTAARLTYTKNSDSIDLVFTPRLTPSRMPLLNQRWVVLPVSDVPIDDLGARYPGGSQYGARWDHIGQRAEFSLSYFDGYNHLPLIDAALRPVSPPIAEVLRFYPRIRTYGADLAVPLRWFTIKSEASYLTSANASADEYLLYVVQAERQAGEWFFVGGYSGEVVTTRRTQRDFAPDRGLSKAFLGRAGYTIDTNRNVAFESAVRQNGAGSWAKLEYSQAFAKHWRATVGFNYIRGNVDDFLGQYRRNSFFSLRLRYSF